VPTFVDRRVSRGQRSSFILTRAEWTHCYSGNLVASGIEPGTSELAARNSDYQTTEEVLPSRQIYEKVTNPKCLTKMCIIIVSTGE
jgi:hypothetical protein